MQVKDLDGNISNWQLLGGISHGTIKNKSSLHLDARELLHKCFPTLQILEEIPIQVRRSETLYLDFYIPLTKKCVEVHGEQHFEYNQFFHKSMLGFVKHKKRDKDKKEWCELNGLTLIELCYNNKSEWENIIKNEH